MRKVVLILSVFEQNKEVIVEEIKSIIESGIFHSIPTVHEYVQNHQEIKEALLQQYIQKTAPELGGCNFREALKQLGVDEATAIMQATLNDTIIIGDDHQLYSNCANDLLSTNKDYYVKSELVLKANRKGLCRGYRLSTSKTVNMENGVGFVRTQKKFNIGMYWVYPIVRVYIEYILMYGKTYGIKIQTQDCTAEFTFNDIIKKRFGTDVGVLSLIHI